MPSEKVLKQKQDVVAELVEQLKGAAAGVLVDYRGLSVAEDTVLRSKLREAGVQYKVVKNTLTRFAANQIGFEELDSALNGPTALAISDDPVAPAKVMAEFAKTNNNLEIKAGFLDGKVISLAEIQTLATTPSRDTLIAKIMGSLNSPASSLVRLLQAIVDKGVEPAELAAGATTEAAEPAEAKEEAPVAEEAAVEEAKEETPAAEEVAVEEAPAENAEA